MAILLVIAFILACVGVEYYRTRQRKRIVEKKPIVINPAYQLKYDKVKIPQGIYFGGSHAWAYLTEFGLSRVGLDDLLKHIIGKIDSIKSLKSDATIQRGGLLFEIIQNDKSLQIASPISGKIKNINQAIIDNPQNALSLSYKDRWVYEIDPQHWVEDINNLSIGRQASAWMKNEFARLKDFFTTLPENDCETYCVPIMQEGGEVAENVLEYGDKKMWEQFQKGFLGRPFLDESTTDPILKKQQ
ncbi:MAG: hypothetical protein HQ509_01740 [Candidatus Marinimicrobia bacterium]|nr:hypothetical protein [Candidatus Neomarinimicrobiota bacterium]